MNNIEKYIVTLDEGTTSVRTLIINKKCEIVGSSQKEFRQFFPCSGWVEHDAEEIWLSQYNTLKKAIEQKKINLNQISAIGITNQRETIVAWDKETGIPIYNAIVWQDQRTKKYCEKINEKNKKIINEKTGLLVSPYFSGTKLRWIFKNVKKAKELLKEKKLLVGTIDTWLIWKLTNKKVYATDITNACRTLLFNIHEQKWDKELCDILEIPIEILPEVKSNSEIYGYLDVGIFKITSNIKIPIAGVIGDQQSALFGQMAINKLDLKITYGTGCFLILNTGLKPVKSKKHLLTTIALKIGKEKTNYAIEGTVFIAGAAIQWLRDGLKIIYKASESDFLIQFVNPKDHRVYVVPTFTGVGAPYWDSTSRGAIFGLERGTKKEHIVKATLESIAYQANDLISSLENDLNLKIKEIKVDGGVSNSDFLMQFQSSISKIKIIKPKNIETTGMGAAYLAGLAVGFWKSFDEIKKNIKIEKEYYPNFEDKKIKKLLKGWKSALKRTFNWTKEIE